MTRITRIRTGSTPRRILTTQSSSYTLPHSTSQVRGPCIIICVVTTIVTVGYGDITPINPSEMCYVTFLMLIGVVSFSFTTGALASIIASYDSKEAKLKEKMAILHDIQKEYKINHEMFNELSKTVQYNHRKKSKDLLTFMEELPHKLRLELAMVIHLQLYADVHFFQGKERSFIAWISTLLRPINVEDENYIYKEGEEVTEGKIRS